MLREHKILWEDKHNERQEHSSHSPLEVLLALRRRGGQVGHRHGDIPLLIEDVLVTQGSAGASQHRANPEHLEHNKENKREGETGFPTKLKFPIKVDQRKD